MGKTVSKEELNPFLDFANPPNFLQVNEDSGMGNIKNILKRMFSNKNLNEEE